jgi:hypothetical protein
MKSRLLVYGLLLVFSVQLLPIKEYGKILYGNQIQEELLEQGDCREQIIESSDDDLPKINSIQNFYLNSFLGKVLLNRVHPSVTRIFSQFPCDIPTPPPLLNA